MQIEDLVPLYYVPKPYDEQIAPSESLTDVAAQLIKLLGPDVQMMTVRLGILGQSIYLKIKKYPDGWVAVLNSMSDIAKRLGESNWAWWLSTLPSHEISHLSDKLFVWLPI